MHKFQKRGVATYALSLTSIIILASCGQNENTSGGGDVPIPTLPKVAEDKYSAMSQAISRDASLKSILSDDKNLITLVIVRDPGFSQFLSKNKLSEDQFLAHPKLLNFLKGHILLQKIKSDGNYKSLSGKNWQVDVDGSRQPSDNTQISSINGIDIVTCQLAYTSYNSDVNRLSQYCLVDSPIVSLE